VSRLDLTGRTAIITGVTKQLALELSPKVDQLNSATALGRIGEPDDGSVIAFLVSDAASWVTGETFVIDGGQRLGDAGPFRKGVNVA
jgi:hypothetical protein